MRPRPWPRLVRLIAYRGSGSCPDYYECSVERHHVYVVAQHRWWIMALALAWMRSWAVRKP